MPLRRGRKLRHATPDVFTVSRRTGRKALGQDALKLRFAGSAELQVMVVLQLARDGWPVVQRHRSRLRPALGASGRCHRTESGDMRHRAGMILAAVMTRVLFCPRA
jgi:hypothetical protein